MKYQKFDKPPTIMFKEGSVFPVNSEHIKYGSNLIVKQKDETKWLFHNVYQYGLGFMIKIKINK